MGFNRIESLSAKNNVQCFGHVSGENTGNTPGTYVVTPERYIQRGTPNPGKFEEFSKFNKSSTKVFIQPLLTESTTQEDVSSRVSDIFFRNCDAYYQRIEKIKNRLMSDNQAAEKELAELINSGPMYPSDLEWFLSSFEKKFKRSFVAGEYLIEYRNFSSWPRGLPPMNIHTQEKYMDKKGDYEYKINGNHTASESLAAMENKFCLIDCSMACQIAYYRAIHDLIGEVEFNRVFDYGSEMPFEIALGHELYKTKLQNFISPSEVPIDNKQKHLPPGSLHKGTIYYFKNHKDFLEKHPCSHLSGYNVMLTEPGQEVSRFTAFGLPGRGLTPCEIGEQFVAEFNRPASSGYKNNWYYKGADTSKKKEIDEIKQSTITLGTLYSNGGGWYPSVGNFLDLEKLRTFASNNARELSRPSLRNAENE